MGVINIDLPVIGEDGREAGVEAVTVEQLGLERFKLIYSPGFVEGLAAGDEFEIANDSRLGYRAYRYGGNLCVWFYVATIHDPHQDQRVEAQRLQFAVEAIGGRLDGGAQGLLVFTVVAPGRFPFPAVQRVFDEAVQRNPESTYLFANIYDPNDRQTLLDWWN